MTRVNYHLTDQQLARLRAESERSGLTVAEVIRRAVDRYLDAREKKEKPKHE